MENDNKKQISWLILAVAILISLIIIGGDSEKDSSAKNKGTKYNLPSTFQEVDYYDGYDWAESNDISDFSDCDDEFGAGTKAEDGCNEYVQENEYYIKPTFNDYGCTEDCSGHEAGYYWAENNGIDDIDDCGGNSNSFIEGCMSYVEENY